MTAPASGYDARWVANATALAHHVAAHLADPAAQALVQDSPFLAAFVAACAPVGPAATPPEASAAAPARAESDDQNSSGGGSGANFWPRPFAPPHLLSCCGHGSPRRLTEAAAARPPEGPAPEASAAAAAEGSAVEAMAANDNAGLAAVSANLETATPDPLRLDSMPGPEPMAAASAALASLPAARPLQHVCATPEVCGPMVHAGLNS